MKSNQRRIAAIAVLIACVAALASVSYAFETESPALLVLSGEQTFLLELADDVTGKWLWLQVPDDVPLGGLSVRFSLENEGILDIFAPDTPDTSTLNFENSDDIPYPFVIRSAADGATPLWTGWLTVAHQVRPEGLPETPDQPAPPAIEMPTEAPIPTALPIPTQTLIPTAAPTLTPAPVRTLPPDRSGYGVVLVNEAPLTDVPFSSNILSRLRYGDVVYINGQAYDPLGHIWHRTTVLATGRTGYIDASYVRFMTEEEVREFLDQPTQRPTQAPTAEPAPTGYARTIWQSLPLRGWNSATATVIAELGYGDVVYIFDVQTGSDGTRWPSVRTATGVFGHVPLTALQVMTPAEVDVYLESLKPTPSPPPTPVPTPEATLPPTLPTTPPQSLAQKIRAGVDAARLAAYAREQTGAVSYAIQDFDSDGFVELLLAHWQPERAILRFEAYALHKGEPVPLPGFQTPSVLHTGMQLEVSIQQAGGRTFVSWVEWDRATGRDSASQSLTLTDLGWIPVPGGGQVRTLDVLLSAVGEMEGVTLQDHTGLHAGEPERTTQDESIALSVLLQMLRQCVTMALLANGNG